jgi:hypothetical protein
MSTLTDIVKSALPTKWSQWIAGLSMPLLPTSFFFPEFLQKLNMPVSAQVELPVRVAATSTTGLLATLLVLVLVLHHYRSFVVPNLPNEHAFGSTDLLLSVLVIVAKLHSQNIGATPTRIAADLGLDPELTLAYMWKYHNEQFITFANGGKKPDLNTSFFLSPKAWQHIKVVRA